MGRVQVINEIHRNKDFFCKKWVEFCRWVEDCGERLEKYLKEHTDEYYLFVEEHKRQLNEYKSACLLYTSPSPRDRTRSRMPSSA